MRHFFSAFLFAGIAALQCLPVRAQSTVSFVPCVVPGGTGCTSSLRTSSGDNFVVASGYNTPGDGGGGEFQALTCSPTTAGNLNGTNLITSVESTAGVYVNQTISVPGLPSGTTTVMAVSSQNDTITMVASTTATGPATLTFSNVDNGGTIIQDSSSPPQCFYRTDYRGDPHEWGAYGANGSNNDTIALQSWLNWTPGPWNAIIPSNYQVKKSLTCPQDTTIIGSANQVGQNNPPIRIFAGSAFSGPVVLAQAYCRISGIIIDAQSRTDGIDTDMTATRAIVDGYSAVENGNPYNFNCTNGGVGYELKDTELQNSAAENVYMLSACANVRLIGDTIIGAGGGYSNVNFGGKDFTLAEGSIELSGGDGLFLPSAEQVSVVGMDFSNNGVGSSGGTAIHFTDELGAISICGNHFFGNDSGEPITTPPTGAHISFDGTSTGIDLCGNSYMNAPAQPGHSGYPNFVYAATTAASISALGIYENPVAQILGVTSPKAAMAGILPASQVLPAPKSYLTGLVLSNDATATTVDIAAGSATDSTGTMVISLTSSGTSPACKIDLTPTGSGLGHLDASGGSHSSTTYFFFAVADLSGEAPPNCIASANLTPTMNSTNVPSYGAPVYRLIGALYTTGSNTVVPFTQDGDSFYLTTPVTDIKTGVPPICAAIIGTSAQACALSVPCGRTLATCASPGLKVEAFGRIVGGPSVGAGEMLVSSYDQSPALPNSFPTSPGYSTVKYGTSTSFPFRLETDGGGNIRVQASTAITAAEVTDGWVFRRQQ